MVVSLSFLNAVAVMGKVAVKNPVIREEHFSAVVAVLAGQRIAVPTGHVLVADLGEGGVGAELPPLEGGGVCEA
jgi:hypothetical protein